MSNKYDEIFHNAYWATEVDPNLSDAEKNAIRASNAQNVMGAQWFNDQSLADSNSVYNHFFQKNQEEFSPVKQKLFNEQKALDESTDEKDNFQKAISNKIQEKEEEYKQDILSGNSPIYNDLYPGITRGINSVGWQSSLYDPAKEEVETYKEEHGEYPEANKDLQDARREWRWKANDVALRNLSKKENEIIGDTGLTGKELADKLGQITYNNDGSFNVQWTPENKLDDTAKKYMQDMSNMKFYYTNDINSFDDIAPYVSDKTKNIMDDAVTLAKTNGGQDNYWIDTDLSSKANDKISQLKQSIFGPNWVNTFDRNNDYSEAYKAYERQGGDTGNYGELGERMYDDQDFLWLQQGYRPYTEGENAQKVYNSLNAEGITKGDPYQSVDDFSNQEFKDQIVNLGDLFSSNPGAILQHFAGPGTESVNTVSDILLKEGLTSPNNSLKDFLSKKLGSSLSDSGASQVNGSKVIDSLLNKNTQDTKELKSDLNLERGLLNSILLGSNLAQQSGQGKVSKYNPNEANVASLLNYTAPNSSIKNNNYQVYNENENIEPGQYANLDTQSLIYALNNLRNNPMGIADNENNLLDLEALREAIRRQKNIRKAA